MSTCDFAFLDPGVLRDEDLWLYLIDRRVEDWEGDKVPSYIFHMHHTQTRARMGRITLRLGSAESLVRYIGHIGYGVDAPYRGNRYALRSCKLLLPFAYRHGYDEIWITCDPDNLPSRRTLEHLGEMVEIVDVPVNSPAYASGHRKKCRFRVRTQGSE